VSKMENWKVTVQGGQTIFGDNARMNVSLPPLQVRDQAAAEELVGRLEQASRAGAMQDSLSSTESNELLQGLRQILEEIRKPQEARNAGFLRKSLDQVTTVASAVPGLVKIALELKSALGF